MVEGKCSRRRDWACRILIPLLFFAASAPTLPWTEFAGGAENIVVATAMEMRRSGQWLIPTLAGQHRLAKPPLAAWVAAISIDRSTFAKTLSDNPAVRDSAYRTIAWEVRWPALLCGCLTLALTYDLGRILAGRQIGLIAALAHGASYGFLRYSRIASSDVQLALWVTAANFFLAKALLENKRWLPIACAAAAMALAFISKGPVSLLQTLLPFALFSILFNKTNPPAPNSRRWLLPALAGAAIFILIALPWFLYVASRTNAWRTWYIEVLRQDPIVPKGSPLNYLTIFALILPWSAFFIAGTILAITQLRQRPLPRITYALFLGFIPILVMVFFPDRKERYLLPMLAPCAILVAHGLLAMRDPLLASRMKFFSIAHYLLLLVLAVGLPIAGSTTRFGMKTFDGQPWFSPLSAIIVGAVAVQFLFVSLRLRHLGPPAIVAPTVLIMLLLQPLLLWGYSRSDNGRSDMKQAAFDIRQKFPDIPAYSFRPGRRPPEDLTIYMNRTIYAINDLSRIPPSTHPQLLFLFQGKSQIVRSLPAYWVPIDTYPKGEGIWRVYHHP